LAKIGAGTLTLTGNNTFDGTTVINGGTLNANATGGDKALGGTTSIVVNAGGTLMTSSDQQFNAAPAVTLAGGTIATNGTSQTLGALTLTSSAIIDMGDGASILNFANSSSQLWAANAIISIYNWSGDKDNGAGTDQLYFGSDNTGLTSGQLSQFRFYSDAGITPFWSGSGGAMFANGEVVPVPEPATWIGALLTLGAIGYSQRRRISRLIKRSDERVSSL